MKNEIVLFTDGDINLEVELSPELETVWLTQKQMEELFDVKHATVSEHISNILSSGELDGTSVGFSDKSSGGRKPKIYNLDMILSVGYRVNSKRGIAFRRWANSVLKQYVIQGYAINEKRLQALERTVEYVQERKQFGRTIGQFQNTQFQLADMATKVKAAQLLVYRAAMAKKTQKVYSVEAAMAKLYAAEVAMEVTTKAVQLHGGYGYTREYDVERMMRDAKITEIYEGTSEVQRMVISASLLK